MKIFAVFWFYFTINEYIQDKRIPTIYIFIEGWKQSEWDFCCRRSPSVLAAVSDYTEGKYTHATIFDVFRKILNNNSELEIFSWTTPFSLQIKIIPVQIKIIPVQIKIIRVQVKILLSIWFCLYIVVIRDIKKEIFVIYYTQ